PRPASEVRVGEGGRHPALRGADEEPLLDEEGLVDVLDRVPLLPDRGRERVEADRPAGELVDDGEEQRAVHLVEARLVDVEEPERVPRDLTRDEPAGADLGEVAHPTEEAVRDPRRTTRAPGDLDRPVVL